MNEYNIRRVFAQNVKKYRLNQNLSQEQLAELTELHRTYISDVERQTRSISLDNIAKIAFALKIEAHLLFVNIEEEK